ncbi:MAG: non-ribosomal peptide synthetase, partial [Flammeovirgaceae bacterium]
MALCYDFLLTGLLSNESVSIDSIPLFPPQIENDLIDLTGKAQHKTTRSESINEWLKPFLQQTNARVLVCGDTILSNHELNSVSNRLAHFFREKCGIKREERVGIVMDRSERMIASILGVLKTGGCFVPLDPSYPADWLRYMITDAGARVVITDTGYVQENVRIIDWNNDLEQINKENNDDLTNINSSTDLAYVIYTSGSTGEPKGVGVSHGNLIHYISWANDYYFSGRGPLSHALFTSVGFDLSYTSVFCSLSTGGSLHIYGQQEDMDVILRRVFVEDRIDMVKLTPSHISMLRDLNLGSSLVNIAIVGGEELKGFQVSVLKGLNNDIRIFNEYGPTETTIGCSVAEIISAEGIISIGRPIRDTSIYLVDSKGHLVARGMKGELYIGGAGVSLGYLNNKDQTAERFISNPFGEGLLYRSGDIGRYLDNGDIEYLGRADTQVKLRGYRIEPGEIERRLLEQPGVEDAVVLVKGGSGSEYLCGYIRS